MISGLLATHALADCSVVFTARDNPHLVEKFKTEMKGELNAKGWQIVEPNKELSEELNGDGWESGSLNAQTIIELEMDSRFYDQLLVHGGMSEMAVRMYHRDGRTDFVHSRGRTVEPRWTSFDCGNGVIDPAEERAFRKMQKRLVLLLGACGEK